MDDAELDELVTTKVKQELAKYLRQNESNEPSFITPDTFENWLRNQTAKAKALYSTFLAIPGSTAIFALILKTIQSTWTMPKFERLLLLIEFLQFIVVFILYWFIPHPDELNEYTKSRIEENLRKEADRRKPDIDMKRVEKAHNLSIKFSRMWSNAWIAWAILYFAWALIILATLASGGRLFNGDNEMGMLHRVSWLTGFLNNLSSVFLYMCYRELAFPTKTGREDQRQPLFYLLTLLGIVAVFDFTLSTYNMNSPVSSIPGWIGSFAAGAVIALLIGRLESKFVDPPVVMTAALYIYAAIQGSFVLFPIDPYLMLALTSAAFFFKIILFLLVAWLLGSGVLTFYLAEIAILHETIPQRKADFVKAIKNKEGQDNIFVEPA